MYSIVKSPAVEIHRGFNCGYKANVCKETYGMYLWNKKTGSIYGVYEGCNSRKQDNVVLRLFGVISSRKE